MGLGAFAPVGGLLWYKCSPVSLWSIAAVEIYTPHVLEAVNGTDVQLKCTFSSFAPVGDALTVTWNFRLKMGGLSSLFSTTMWIPSDP